MSFLSRVKGWLRSDEPSTGEPPAEGEHIEEQVASARAAGRARPVTSSIPAIDRLSRLGEEKGPSVEEALVLLRQVRGTIHESAGVAAALGGIGQRAVPEPIRVACADILAARGDEVGALRLLEGVTSTPALVLSADLHAAAGQLARAASTIERVLAREIDAPGARERHQRWSQALGVVRGPARRLDEATVVAHKDQSSPFRLLREVARGGAGTVYEAEDDLLGRKIAFKVYHGRGKDRPALEREARTAVALAGPGVLRVLDADPDQGWLALEWVARGSLRDLLRAGDFAPLASIGKWARPLARALARVHAEGLVHADVKPANVLLRRPHDPVLGDFGIARRMGSPGESGSPGYLSPERLAGREGHPRDDVYGYGRILEDVLHRLGDPDDEGTTPWRELMLACLGPDEGRPGDGAELVARLP